MVAISRLATLLSAGIALTGVLPIMAWIDLMPQLVFLLCLVVALVQELKGVRRIGNWQLNLVLLPVFGWYLLNYSRSNPIQPVVSLLVIMLAARLCGEQSNRNLMQINLLALFCLASRSLYDLSPAFLVWLGLLLLLTSISLVLLTFHDQDVQMLLDRQAIRRLAVSGILIVLLSTPILLILFPILPRTAFPLWNFMQAKGAARGLSDKVDPGRADAGATLPGLAFRAEMPRQSETPYWRGIVFNRLNGNNWVRSQAVPAEEIRFGNRQIPQTIYPEPGPSRMLLSLDAPVELYHLRIRQTPDLLYELPRQQSRRLSYTISSDPSGILQTEEPINRQFYLQLPASVDPRFHQLATEIRRKGQDEAERLRLAEQYYHNNRFSYSRKGLPSGPDALATFMFSTRKGHCEFFAASYGILLRASGIPARLVGGYLGGEYNQLGGYYLVAEDLAHVWVEAWLEGRGWLRIDPTRFAVNAGELLGKPQQPGLALRLRMFADALEYRWNRSVVSYDFEQQVSHLKAAGSRLQKLEQAFSRRHLYYLVALLIGGGLIWLLRERVSLLWLPPEQRLVRRFRRLMLDRYAIDMAAENLGLFEAAAASNNPDIQEAAKLLASLLYSNHPSNQDIINKIKELLNKAK